MEAKGVSARSPKPPMTKEVFPEEMKRAKPGGKLMHRPTTGTHSRKKLKPGANESEKEFVAKGTTVKSTPKSTTKKVASRYKENLSVNQMKSGAKKSAAKPWKARSEKTTRKVEIKMAKRIQKWWRHILQERECLRSKLIAARKALEERKQKLIEKSLKSLVKAEDTSVCEVENSNEGLIDVEKSAEKKESDELQTACFGKFNLEQR